MATARTSCGGGCRWPGPFGPLSLLLLLHLFLATLYPAPAQAQNRRQDNSIISPTYFASLPLLYQGEYELAARGLEQARRGAIRSVDARWIDSICYFTMLGEVHLRIGELREAHQNYEAALRLYIQYSDWMLRVQFPERIEPQPGLIAAPPWGNTTRRFRLGRFPKRFHIVRGGQRIVTFENRTAITNVNQLHPLHVDELVRCSCLAIRRRAEMLGPTARHDTLLQEVVKRLSADQGPVNHWSRAWIDLQLGFALAGVERTDQAIKALERSLLAAGEFDHPLSCLAMLELGRLAVAEANHAAALRWLEEATYSAYYFDRPEVLQEAFQLAHSVHVVQQGRGVYPPLGPAIRWTRSQRLYELHAMLLTAATESHVLQGDLKAAVTWLGQARQAVKRNDIDRGAIGAEFGRVAALVGYLSGDPQEADRALGASLEFMRRGAIRLFHMEMVDEAFTNGLVRERVALELYPQVLGDPSPFDWRYHPLEALACMLADRPVSLQNWFRAAMQRDDLLATLDVVQQIRSRRFTSTLPLGGRLLNLRWILQAPAAALPPIALIQRKELVGRFPEYAQLEKRAEKIRAELKQHPLLPDENQMARQQADRMQQLAQLAVLQENVLKQIAIGRTPATMVFPPRRSAAAVQQKLPKGQALLCFHVTEEKHDAFLLTYNRARHWPIHSPDTVRQQLIRLLRAMGHYDPRRPLSGSQLNDESWRPAARQLLAEITRDAKIDLGTGITALAIVPDGLYWYVPFEALQVGQENNSQSLITKMRIRYAPTLGLTIPLDPAAPRLDQYAVVAGKLFPREDDRLAADALQTLRGQLPRTYAVTRDHSFRADVAATFLDGIVVLDEIEPPKGGPYKLAPLQVDAARPGSSLGEWMMLPWGSPQVVVLPGFRTPAEDALKRLPAAQRGGEELFLTTMGLQAAGTRTILISRWRTAGRTANNLVIEFLQELPHASADDAWQRSVQLAQETQVDPEFEPRVENSDAVNAPATHPFLWSGYMLIDPGREEDLGEETDRQEPDEKEAAAG
ncbi:MAG: CHAT domain-containing protein [Planctomycetales bacterium]|nr:CHAT domain-containing protein [Planctomycetales bacterium]NIM09372.1 CHAT domain-containing protein [Planctomycetales bacterium]NIN08839.1 CHAT domain-containing protein [Planctomycetales bacterium]NIN77956.1 CHAT domain-containing protein [Planctomycetales bacterium]NIO47487.1 CHAT domain-containing protein [Planctomycetales bacterium]